MLSSLRNPFVKHLLRVPPRPLFFSPSSLPSTTKFNTSTQISPRLSTLASSTRNEDYLTAPYSSVQITCPRHVSDTFSEALLCFGASSTSIDEPDELQDSETTEICINSIFTECEDIGTCILHAASSIGLKEIPSYKVVVDDKYGWIKKTQESFHPVEITEGFWIVPEWITPPDLQATNIILNPGLAFGTGDHPTTKLCLLLLRDLIKGGEVLFDYGTGSGILGIAALKLGASLAVGIDIDPESVTSARQNAALNNIGPEKMQVHLVPCEITGSSANEKPCGDEAQSMLEPSGKYDIVIANILLNPLLELADNIIHYAKPGGIVGISGILSEQFPRIEERYSPYLQGMSVSEMDGWVCVSGTKKTDLESS